MTVVAPAQTKYYSFPPFCLVSFSSYFCLPIIQFWGSEYEGDAVGGVGAEWGCRGSVGLPPTSLMCSYLLPKTRHLAVISRLKFEALKLL